MNINSFKTKFNLVLFFYITISILCILSILTLSIFHVKYALIFIRDDGKNSCAENVEVINNIIDEYGKNIDMYKIPILNYKVIKLNKNGENNTYNSINYKIIAIICTCIAIVFIFSQVILHYYMKPFKILKQGIHKIEKGNLSYKIKMNDKYEIGQLADSINLMTQSLTNEFKEIENQTDELHIRNQELEETNMELESSYQQLRAAVQQLEEAESKYEQLVKNIPEIVCVVGKTGTIEFVNYAVKDVLAYNVTELTGKNVQMVLKCNNFEGLVSKALDKLKNENKITMELNLVRKDGKEIIADTSISKYVYYNNILGFQIIARDVTQKKKLERQIVTQNEELGILSNVSKTLNSSIDLNKVLHIVSNEIIELLKIPFCIIRLLDSDGEFLCIKAAAGSYFGGACNIDKLPKINIHDDIMGEAVLDNKLIHTYKFSNTWLVHSLNLTKKYSEKIKDVTIVPLRSKDKPLGVVIAGSNKGMREVDINMLYAIANNASIAVDNALMYENSKQYFIKTLNTLVAAIEAKDKYTKGHSRRVSNYAAQIGRYMGLKERQIEELKIAGVLHDIGKIGISDKILLKNGKLTCEEYNEIKKHPIISKKILQPIGLRNQVLSIIEHHHERYDGKGYPFGVKGCNMSIEAQIISVADAFDAMTSNRPYRASISIKKAIEEIVRNKGQQFNPNVVDALVNIYSEGKLIINQDVNNNEIIAI